MDIKKRAQLLAGIDLFHSFSEKELLSFAKDIKEVTFAAGEHVFEEDSTGMDMFILLKGSITIFKDSRFITQIEPIDYVGEMSILENKPRSATATALTPVHLFQITKTQFDTYFAHQPQSLVSMMKTLSTRVRKDTKVISEEFHKANILIHDMRNRLSAFLLLNNIEKDTLSDKSKRYLTLMQRSYADLATMTDEALANAKHLKYTPIPEEISLDTLFDEMLHTEFLLHKALQGRKIRIDIPADFPIFFFPQNDLRRVLTNLVINAGQASTPGLDIQIQASIQNEEITISIADKGCGIPDHIRAKIFDPHFTTKEDGNGFGLASCKDIIEKKNKGRIGFQSNQHGTIFTFSVPVKIADNNQSS